MDWASLLRGELRLTADIFAGFMAGGLIIRTGLAGKALRRVLPRLRRWGIGAELCAALAVSTGSSKAGAAVVASALDSGRISQRTAIWGTLLLAFPAYVRRWAVTLVLSCSLVGWAGAFFALALLFRSAAKFAVALFILSRGGCGVCPLEGPAPRSRGISARDFGVKLLKTLPLAWLFYACAVLTVPWVEKYLRLWLCSSAFFPPPAVAVAAASCVHVSAALALAGSSLAAGGLSAAQAVFALLFGNSLGLVLRLVRTNAGYYFGFFPRAAAQSMLFWNIAVSAGVSLLVLALAAMPLCL